MSRTLLWYSVLCCCATHISYCDPKLHHNYRFELVYEWSVLNFTWPSSKIYANALHNRHYIPENNVPTGLKIYKQNLYLSLPKFRKGVPITLAHIHMGSARKKNELLTPFPTWEMNDERHCSNLQSVQSMEIDTDGIMWVLDGVRLHNNVNCPTKLVFLDLNNHGRWVSSYVFPNEIGLQDGGFINDIVIDDTDGGYAYITDNSNIDPGLIVYSRKKNRAWKMRDRSMFSEPWAANFVVEGVKFDSLLPIDGIALSPKPSNPYQNRTVFYTSLTGVSLFAISTSALRDEELCRSDRWRKHIQYVGEKESQTDGMVIDSRGTLFYTLLPLYGVGSWNIWEPFGFSSVVETDRKVMIWPDGFAMDQKGYLYLISNYVYRYLNPNTELRLTPDVKFRVTRLYTGTRSYLYNDL